MAIESKKKLIYSSLSLLIVAIVYFLIYKKCIKPKKTGCVKTIIKHKDGKVLEKNSIEETINSPEIGVFLFTIFIILMFVFVKKFIFSSGSTEPVALFSSDKPSSLNIDVNSCLP